MTAAWRLPVFLAFLVLVAVLPLTAQDPKFSDTTEVTAVEIPVQVLLDGKPVRGLTAESFAVYRDKARQPITGFDVVDLAGLPGEDASEVPVPARRHFLMLFDLSFSEPKSIVQARSAAKDLLAELHPADLVAVATYASSSGPELVLGFTSDRDQVRPAIDSLGLPQLVDRTPDPLRLILQDARQGSAEAADIVQEHSEAQPGVRPEISGPQVARAMGDLAVLEQMERAEREIDRADVEALKRKVSLLTRSFTDLAKFLRSVEGRKYVVYLSEGFDSSILTGVREQDEREETEHSGQAGRIWEVNADQRFGHGSATNAVSSMLEEFRRADCIIQAVDIGGLRGTAAGGNALGFERTGGGDSLFQMARDTGGDLYENFNDLSAAMGTMLERTGVTYVLTIQPDQQPDGTYHTLRVETKGLPRGARVVHRPGYYAPKPYAQRSPTERMLHTAGQVLAGAEGGLVRTSALAVPLPGSGSLADVPVVIEIDGPSLLHLHQGDDVPVEIYVYAVDEKGKVGDYLAQTLSLDLLKVEAKLLQAGLKFYGHLELPPGSYKARVLVRNGRTGAHGLRVLPLEVPATASAANPGRPILLPPFFPEPKGQWLVLREAPRPGRRDVPVPFRMGDQPFLPAATPILDGGESRFALLGYNLADEGELRVRSQVLTADGHELQAGDVALVSRATGEAGADRLELTFRPPALQPGEYLLRITITGADGKAGTSTAPFVVAAAGPDERS